MDDHRWSPVIIDYTLPPPLPPGFSQDFFPFD
jgi:hypothetical protein